MPVDFGLVLPPWNFSRAEGNLLDRVVGEVGIDHLTVPAITGPLAQYRLSGEIEPPYFYTEGGWHFSPQPKLYAPTGVRPHVAHWAGARDTLGPMREYASKHALKFVLRLDFQGFQGPLASLPETRMRTAWGNELGGYGACTSSPAFREVVQAVLADLQACEPDGCELDCICTGEEELQLGTAPPLLWEGPLRHRVQTCFCPACRQTALRAGVDVSAAIGVVQSFGRAYAAAGLGITGEMNEKLAGLGQYWKARRADLDSWIERLAGVIAPRTLYVIDEPIGKGQVKRLARDTRYDDRDKLKAVAALESAFGGSSDDVAQVTECFELGRKTCSDLVPTTGLVWNLLVPANRTADSLVRSLAEAVGSGLQFVEFERVEEMPEQAITWLKQAVRYARRQSEGQ